MEEQEFTYGRIPIRYRSRQEAMAEYEERIRYCEDKYGMSSNEMRNLLSTGDDKWETLEILKWMSADRAYRNLLQGETPTAGKISITTESPTSGD